MTTPGFGTIPFGTGPFGLGGGAEPEPPPPPVVVERVDDFTAQHTWTAYARNSTYKPTVALPIIGAQLVVRHVGVGSAVLTTSYTRERWDALQPGAGLILYRDGRVEFSGPVRAVEVALDESGGRATIQVEAKSDEQVLAERLVFPDPLRAEDDQTVNDYWKYTGAASGAMRRLISDQAGPTCHAGRRVTGLTLAPDPNVGVSRSWTGLFASGGNLLGALGQMSVASGANLGVRVTGSEGALVASVYEPRDMSEALKFSVGLRNLRGFSYRLAAPTVTHAVAAGQGDLKARMRRAARTTDPLALEWRMQSWAYVDRRDTADAAELVQAAQDAVTEGAGTIELTLSLSDSQAASYGADWGLGDRIRVFIGFPDEPSIAEVAEVVREIAFEVGADGSEKITPAVGTADATALPSSPTQRQLRAVGLRLSALESNK